MCATHKNNRRTISSLLCATEMKLPVEYSMSFISSVPKSTDFSISNRMIECSQPFYSGRNMRKKNCEINCESLHTIIRSIEWTAARKWEYPIVQQSMMLNCLLYSPHLLLLFWFRLFCAWLIAKRFSISIDYTEYSIQCREHWLCVWCVWCAMYDVRCPHTMRP